jgi:hypothetical protein
MKIGFSFGRCLRDLVDGTVKLDDVMCIIARTHMITEEHVKNVITEYTHRRDYLMGLDPAECERIGLNLWKSGKILEPRANGISASSVPRDYIWMDLYPTEADVTSDGVKEAWEAYRLMIALTEQLPEPNEQVYHHSQKFVSDNGPVNLDDIDPAILAALIT